MRVDVTSELLIPNVDDMLTHLRHLFGGYLYGAEDGLIEIAWTNTYPEPDGKYKLNHAEHFETDQLEEAAQRAVDVNSNYLCNVYVSGALRKPETSKYERAGDADFYMAASYWADLDSSDSVASAKQNYVNAKPTLLGLTGAYPDKRLQCWWKLTATIDNPDQLRNSLMGIAYRMGSDTTVTNPGRVMRLMGSIAWPHKPGRIAEMTKIIQLKSPGLQEYDPEHLEQVFPSVISFAQARERRGADGGDGTLVRETVLGLPIGKAVDGRKGYMMRVIEAVMITLIGPQGIIPTVDELYDASWPTYEAKVDLTRPGAGPAEFRKQCAYTIKRFTEGRIRGLRSIAEAQESWARKNAARSAYVLNDWQKTARDASMNEEEFGSGSNFSQGSQPGPSKPLILTASEFVAGFTPPEYLVDGIIQRGYIYSLTARTSHGKTVVSMYLAQAVARGTQFHGRKVLQGSVLFLAGENPDDIRARYLVLADKHGFNAGSVPFHFISGIIDIPTSLPRIRQEAAAILDLRLVVVDTAAAYFPGDDGNSNAQAGAYARLLRQLTFLPGLPTVIVNSHPIKNALRENLIPVGGGAFLNEMDGNMTLWSAVEQQTELHWQGKFRGPEFEPLMFRMDTVTCDSVRDAEGRLMPSVVAMPMGEMEITRRMSEAQSADRQVLSCISLNPTFSLSEIAQKLGWVMANGVPYKVKVKRSMERLRDDKLIKKAPFGKTEITDLGWAELK